jgi:hypothetical protein
MHDIRWVPQRVILHALVGPEGAFMCSGIGTQTLEDIFLNCAPAYPVAIVEQSDGRIIAVNVTDNGVLIDDIGLVVRPTFVTTYPDVNTAIAAVSMQLIQ